MNDTVLRDLRVTPYAILEKLSIKEIATLLKKTNKAYTQGHPILTDDLYELVFNYLAKLAPEHPLVSSEVGAPVTAKQRVPLPVWMGSLNKIKDDPVGLERWATKNKGPYVVSDKLDGISALVQIIDGAVHMFTRGDGTHGQLIDHLIPYINLPRPRPSSGGGEHDMLIRGELILPRSAWDTILDRTNPRNTVAGLANTRRPDKKIASLVHFVAYECIEPRLPPSEGAIYMRKAGFEIVHHAIEDVITVDMLSDILMKRRAASLYDIDGIVVRTNHASDPPEEGNPSYAFAFKSILTHDKAEVIVKEVKWNVSKNGYLKPVVVFDTVFLAGVHISRASGHNAQMIEKKGIGPGARIIIIRSGDVIPYIYTVLAPAGAPALPDAIQYPWKWNDSHVDAVLKDPEMASEYTLRRLINYAQFFNIKGLGAKLIKRLYDTGIDSIKRLANVTKIELYKACRSAEITRKIYAQLQAVFTQGRCVEFMSASNIFGSGMGQSKLKLMTESIPSTLDPDAAYPDLSQIMAIKGIGERNARQFLNHLADFHEFMMDAGLPCRSTKVTTQDTPEGCMSVAGKNIVFTGFRSKELSEYVEQHGGRVMSSVSRSTHIVVARFKEDESTKAEQARELEIPLMDRKEFEEEIGFILVPNQIPAKEDIDEETEFHDFMKKIDQDMENEKDNDTEDSEDEASGQLNKTAECVRHAMNWSSIKRGHIFGKSAFNPEQVRADLPMASPKLEALIAKIKRLDKNDLEKHGKLFKHMVFTDVYKRGYGAKIVAAALSVSGFKHAYNSDFKLFPTNKPLRRGHSSSSSDDSVNGGASGGADTFAVLASTQLYTKPISVDFKRKLLGVFNQRPENIHGNLIRIMVLDTGYKEGIDLFDIKYVHLFEPLLTVADEMQAMGRALRFCGQRGLHFDKGWTVHVYKYEHVVPQQYADLFGGTDSLTIIMNQLKRDERLMELARDFERVAQIVALDRVLNYQVHSHTHHMVEPSAFQEQIAKQYANCKWPPAKIENLCVPLGQPTSLPELSYSQRFIQTYFQPACPQRGMMLWHSLGSGKTCTALSTASFAWEASGYTIMWITRGTLRSDVYKNMFDQSCVERIRDYVKAGNSIPDTFVARRRLLSKAWLPPLSYKQFNNTLERSNRLFDFLVKRNGFADPFKRTLLIIDEAHLMVSSAMKERDRPNVGLLKTWLRHSYKTSGADSARVLLMSATPITDNPFDFMRLLNLLGTEDVPETPQDVTKAFLDAESLRFTDAGIREFQKTVGARISYLNRMKDVRQFAQPVMHTVHVSISEPEDISEQLAKIEAVEAHISENQEHKTSKLKEERYVTLAVAEAAAKAECDALPTAAERRACVTAARSAAKAAKAAADEDIRRFMTAVKGRLTQAKKERKLLKDEIRSIQKNDVSILNTLTSKCFPKES
jgi:NAD-dependent DNA ligase